MTKRARIVDCVDTPADAPLLRAIAADVEEMAAGYAFGHITGAQLRKLADRLDLPAFRALSDVADEMDREDNPEIVLVFVETPSEHAVAIGLDAGIRLLTALSESEPTKGAT